MGIVVKQSIKASIVTYIGMAIGALNVLWLSAKFLTPDQIGTVKFVNETGFLFAMVAAFGSSAIVDKYFPYWKNEEKKHHGFWFYILAYSLLGLLVFTILFFLIKDFFIGFYYEESPDIINYYFYFLPFTFFLIYQSVAEAYLRAHMIIVFPNIIREIFLKTTNGILIVLYSLDIINFDTLIFLFVLSFGVAAILLFLYIKKIRRFYLNRPVYDFPRFKEMSNYGFYVILASVGSMMVSRIDVLMLPAMEGMGSTGIYTVALMICLAIEVPKKSVFQITIPILSQALKSNDIPKVGELYRKTSINLFLGGAFLFIGIWSSIDELFQIIPNSKTFEAAKYVVFWIAMSKLLDMLTSINSEIIYYSRYYRFFMVLTIALAVTTIIFNRILIPIYGALGAAISMTISLFLFNAVKTIFVYVKFKIQPFNNKTPVVFLISFFTWGIVEVLPGIVSPFLSLILKSILITLVFTVLAYIFRISEEVNSILVRIIKKIKI